MADSEYKYEIIDNEDDARDCAQLIAEEFSAYNPITVFDHITPTCFFEETSWPLMKDMLHEHLSFLARHRPTNEIIAAIIAGDLYLQHKNKHLCDTSNLLRTIPVGDLLDEMDSLFISRDFGQELKPNMILHITVCAVRSQHAGKGVAKEIVQNICDYAREKQGFQYILVQVTNQATRHIFVNKMGGTEVAVIDPTTWIWKKKDDELSCPYKDYKGGSIPNILVKL